MGVWAAAAVVAAAVVGVQTVKVDPEHYFTVHEVSAVRVEGEHTAELRTTIPTARDFGTNGTLLLLTKPTATPFAKGFSAVHKLRNGTTVPLDVDAARFHSGVVLEHGAPVAGSHVQLHLSPTGTVSAVVRTPRGDEIHVESAHRFELSADAAGRARRAAHPPHLLYRRADLHPDRIAELHNYCGGATPPGRLRRESGASGWTRRGDAQAEVKAVPGSPLFGTAEPEPLAASGARVQRGNNNNNVRDCRDTSSGSNGRCDCAAALVADTTFLQSGNIEGESPVVAAQYMVNLALSADQIYRNARFGNRLGVGLAVGHVAIDESSTLNQDLGSAQSLLETFSKTQNWNDMCVAHLFTHRNYYGTLGLAYIGTLCTSDNTGFHSSYGVPQVVQLVTFTHEIGHNWGAYHDTTDECAPGSDDGGNYIMYPAATTGNLANNLLFSSCSRSSMTNSISSRSCFTQSMPHCGNGIVEDGEDCDCGLSCSDTSCCTSSCTVNYDAGYACSPQDPIRFPCCTPEDGTSNQCQIVSASASLVCDDEDNCDAESVCDGSSATCPAGVPKPDFETECGCVADDCTAHPRTGDKVCMGGVCNVSRCALTGASPCDSLSAQCALACQGSGWGNGSECISTFDGAARHPNQTWGINYEAGHVCNNLDGYCTAGGSCQLVGSDLQHKWTVGARGYVAAYWWGALLAIIAMVGLQMLVMRLHRMKRQRGYEALDDDGAGRQLHTTMVLRDGFEKTEPYDTADEYSSDEDDADADGGAAVGGNSETARMHEFYERERRVVIFEAYKRQFNEAETEQALEEHGQALKKVIDSGNLDQRHVIDLRKVYVARLNQLRGFEEEENLLRTTFDAACAGIDRGRQAASRMWTKTKREVKRAATEYEREIERQEYVYY